MKASALRLFKAIALPISCTLLAACGAGGAMQTQLPLVQTNAAATPSTTGSNGSTQIATAVTTVPVQITLPRPTSSTTRQAMYVSPSTQSLSVSVSAPNATTSTTTVNCSSTCSATVQAPLANDTFTITLYNQTNAGGSALSTGSVTQQITSGQTNSVSVTLKGIVASASVTAGATVNIGQQATIPLNVTARDAANNVITGEYETPISVAISDSSGAMTLSTTTLSSSTSAISAQYSGSSSFKSAAVSLSVSGVAAGNLSGTTILPNTAPVTITIG